MDFDGGLSGRADEAVHRFPGTKVSGGALAAELSEVAGPSYPYFFTGIRIGNDFAMVTNPDELFCEFGLGIKKQSPFKYTMVVEQTNGAYGYVPTAQAFNDGGYETWFGEHSQLTTRAGDIIEKESVGILNDL